jgi:predicted aspartyl protease
VSVSRLCLVVLAAYLLAPIGARAGEPQPEALIAELPFQGDETNRIHLNLAPEGSKRPLRMMLDTGAAGSVFSPGAARDAGVRVRRIKSSPYRRKTALGRDLQFWIDTSASDTGTRMGWEYGLLGCNFLEHYVVELDFEQRRVRFYDPDAYTVPEEPAGPDEVVLKMHLNGKRPMIDLPVDGTKVRFLVDTGAPFPLMIAGSIAEKGGLRADLGEMSASMILGPVAMQVGEAQRVDVGAIALEHVPLLVMPRGAYNWAGPNDSIVGYDTLVEFKVRLDYARRRVWLRRRADAQHTFLGGDWARYRSDGVLVVPRSDGHRIALVAPDGAAAERGVQSGDRLPEGTTPESLVAALHEGRVIVVLRQNRDDVWADTVLPAPEAASGEAP